MGEVFCPAAMPDRNVMVSSSTTVWPICAARTWHSGNFSNADARAAGSGFDFQFAMSESALKAQDAPPSFSHCADKSRYEVIKNVANLSAPTMPLSHDSFAVSQ